MSTDFLLSKTSVIFCPLVLWQLVTICLSMLASTALTSMKRVFLWQTRCLATSLCCVYVLACLRSAFIPDLLYPNKSTRHPLMITTHHRHSVSPSWSTLFSPIPLEDYSRVPPASPAWLSSTSHIDRANIKHCFFFSLFTRRLKEKKKITKVSILVSSLSVFLNVAVDTP